jgi:lipoprotein-releasing system ATP-binding protein
VRAVQPQLSAQNLYKTYTQGGAQLAILQGVSLTLHGGEIVGLIGRSGAGKSTLLQNMGLLDTPDEGEIYVQGAPVNFKDDATRTTIRRRHMGFVYQFHYLLPEFTALENVMMPLIISDYNRADAAKEAERALGRLGLAKRLHHKPKMLSGGEQQRVAIARALIHSPSILLADEPTGNLDHTTAEQVFGDLIHHVKAQGLSALIATHNLELAQKMDRALTLEDGQLKPITL